MIDEWDETEVADLEDEYMLLSELGRGGSAVVYHARDRVLGRDVAIKVVRPRPAAAGDDAIARLAREARTVAKLQHANIVTVHAVKRLRDGGLALVMQLVPGRTLKQAITQDGPLPPDQAENILKDVAQALAFAHANGVVHRDVKPENIFLDKVTGRAMLSDFGIAHSTEFDSRLTMTGAAIGTPAYMAPEQIDGAPANARSDVYSLGLVAWEMLTGERPWEGETLYNVIWKQKHDELPAIDELRPGVVPPRLQYIIERMLQKKPAARWAGADGLIGSLTSWVVPGDWRQWEEAHNRRREKAKAEAKAHAASMPRPSTSMATVRFPRGGPSLDASTPRSIIATPRTAQTPVETNEAVDDSAPSWANEPVSARSRTRTALTALAAIVLTGGAVATYSMRDRIMGNRFAPSSAATDVASIPLPIVEPRTDSLADTSAVAGSDTLTARLRDSIAHAYVLRSDSLRRGIVPGRINGAPPAAATVPLAPPASAQAVNGNGAQPGTVPAAIGAAGLPSSTPAVTVRSTDDRAVIAAGGRHSCALASGRVFCWGSNDGGQLGDGQVDSRETADGIVGDLEFAQISAGLAHTCGVTRSGDAYCWGSDEYGQLGDATTTSRSAPVRVAGNMSFQLVRAGRQHSCGLTTVGEVACWGSNASGQLGDGSATARSSPVTLNSRLRFVSLAVGWNHTCAITTEGVAYCWGDNANGQIGDGGKSDQRNPVAVGNGLRFTSIAGGSRHTCAITDAGEAYCWGLNSFGQLGTGGTAEHLTPTRVETSVRFSSAALGAVYSCARTRSGQVWCWGRNDYGQLGDGTLSSRETPVRVAGGVAFTAISISGAHTCGMSVDGDTMCWGYNIEGQLGDGTRNHHPRPTRVPLPSR